MQMITEREIDDLAGRVAALKPEEAEAFEQALAGLRAEHARAEEARVAGLRGMSDEEVVDFVLMDAHPAHPDHKVALQVLRDAGFVRGVTLEAAYREGYERCAYDIHTGPGVPNIYAVDDPDFTHRRDLWLDTQGKRGAAS